LAICSATAQEATNSRTGTGDGNRLITNKLSPGQAQQVGQLPARYYPYSDEYRALPENPAFPWIKMH
jgi:hypothetical protein